MLKRVTLDPHAHARMSANWASEGLEIFSSLEPGKQAQLVAAASSDVGRKKLEALVTSPDDGRDPMTLLVLAIEQVGLDATREALVGA